MPIYFPLTTSNLPISIESIGNHWTQESIYRNEGYPYYHWLQTESGTGEINILQQNFLLTSGAGILIAPFTPHFYLPVDEWQTKFITFNGFLNDSFDRIIQGEPYILAQDSPQFSYSETIDFLVDQHQRQTLDELKLSVESYRFLLELNRQKNGTNLDHHPLQEQYILPIIREIQTNYSAILYFEELSKRLFISSQYLNRIFKKFTGKSPYQYLTDYRINKAKELLITYPTMEIQLIAQKVGFQSPSQFTAIFKQRTQYTPKNFRKLHYQ